MRRTLVLAAVLALIAAPSIAAADPEPSVAPGRVLLGRFTTTFAVDLEHKARASNVLLAAEAIDGRTIAPGAAFSFNDAVGERTAAFGFARATVLRDGMLAEGVGGGACQVASTLHAAALLAGLEVVARSPHSRPSAYIRVGFDATVAYPKIDLKLRNPRAEPLVVRARAANGTLEISVEGVGPRPDVTLTSEILERTREGRVVERDRTLGADEARRIAFGIPGYRIRRIREVRLEDGTSRRDVRIDTYAPVDELVRVAPGFDERRLAAQPDGPSDAPPVRITNAPGLAAPPLVQLRPTTLVTITASASP